MTYRTLAMFCVISSTAALAAVSPCDQIAGSCKASGFIVHAPKPGGIKSGDDLWIDCFCPILQSKTREEGERPRLALPKGNFSALITECRTTQPKFGHCD